MDSIIGGIIVEKFLNGEYDVLVTERDYMGFLRTVEEFDPHAKWEDGSRPAQWKWKGGSKGYVMSATTAADGHKELLQCDINFIDDPDMYNLISWWDFSDHKTAKPAPAKQTQCSLVPAQLHIEELNRKLTACWYQPKYTYFFGGNYHKFDIGDNADWHRDFVLLDDKGGVSGYFSYNYNDGSKSMQNFGLIDFSGNGRELVRQALINVRDMFEHGAQRLEILCFEDNPVKKLYDFYMKRCGGRQVGKLTRACYFDGKYHNAVIYEVLVEDIKN